MILFEDIFSVFLVEPGLFDYISRFWQIDQAEIGYFANKTLCLITSLIKNLTVGGSLGERLHSISF